MEFAARKLYHKKKDQQSQQIPKPPKPQVQEQAESKSFMGKISGLFAPAPPPPSLQASEQLNDQMSAKLGGCIMNPVNQEEDFNTNVLSIDFKDFSNIDNQIHAGDAIQCKKCQAIFNKQSRVYPPFDQQGLEVIQEEEKIESKNDQQYIQSSIQYTQNLRQGERCWVCEFCGEQNIISIVKEEVPLVEDVAYLLESVGQRSTKCIENDITLIFCIDNSGSMSTTTEVKGKIQMKHGLSQEEYEMLKQFIDEEGSLYDQQQYQSRDVTYISRKQCVLAAIETQLTEFKVLYPNRKIGLVTFNDEVVVAGDGLKEPVILAGDKLTNWIDIVDTINQSSQQLMSNTISKSYDTLINRFKKLVEKGQTALGPALLASVVLASKGNPGSSVILCTDGLSNRGLGDLSFPSQLETAKQFYTEVGTLAQNKHVSVSLITISGEQCKTDVLAQVVDMTNGNLTRVNPQELDKDFAEIMKDEIIATSVQLEIQLHNGLKFIEEDNQYVYNNGTLYKQYLGNVSLTSEYTFQYGVKGDEELARDHVDLGEFKSLPFQARITCYTKNGNKILRSYTKSQEITENEEEVLQDTNVEILAQRGVQLSANNALKGDIGKAQHINNKWNSFINNKVSKHQHSAQQQSKISSYNAISAQAQQSYDYFESKPQQQNQLVTRDMQEQDEVASTNLFQLKKFSKKKNF